MVLLNNNSIENSDLSKTVTDDIILASVDIINRDLASVALIEEHDLEASNYEIVCIPGKGKGMIATKKLYPGDIILAETPLIIVPDKTFEDVEKLETYLERKINNMTGDDRDRFLDMADSRTVGEDQFDEFLYSGKFYTNAMNFDGDAAVCPTMARANHSCRPNAEFISRPDLDKMMLVTMYVIEAGQEVNINYMAMTDEGTESRDIRQAFLRKWYGFQCLCTACTLQDDKLVHDDALRETIKELQSVEQDSLDVVELEEMISLVYQIQGKLSYILTLIHPLFIKAGEGSLRRLEYAVSGLSLALSLHGPGSLEANDWKQKVDQERSIHF